MKIKNRDKVVEAFKFNVANPKELLDFCKEDLLNFGVANCIGGKSWAHIRNKDSDFKFSYKTVKEGDWIVRDSDGMLFIADQENFEKEYEIVTEEKS